MAIDTTADTDHLVAEARALLSAVERWAEAETEAAEAAQRLENAPKPSTMSVDTCRDIDARALGIMSDILGDQHGERDAPDGVLAETRELVAVVEFHSRRS